MAMLPILFIVFGLGDLSKVVLIVFGVAPFLVRDVAFAVDRLPHEQMVKAQTLGASTWQVAIRVVLPQIMPRLIEAVRLSLGPAFLFLISAEAIAADTGLGYRIFLVRRYLSMDVILPYVAWITLLAYLMDFAALAPLAAPPSPGRMSRSGADERALASATSGSSTATRSCSNASTSTSPRARSSPSSGPPAPARARSCA